MKTHFHIQSTGKFLLQNSGSDKEKTLRSKDTESDKSYKKSEQKYVTKPRIRKMEYRIW